MAVFSLYPPSVCLLCISASSSPLPLRTLVRLGPTSAVSFNLDHLLKHLSPIKVTFLRRCGFRLQHITWEAHNSAHNKEPCQKNNLESRRGWYLSKIWERGKWLRSLRLSSPAFSEPISSVGNGLAIPRATGSQLSLPAPRWWGLP